MATCSCGRPVLARGLCSPCYLRARRAEGLQPPTDQQRARFHARVARGEGCWLWTGPVAHDGYGKAALGYITMRAHRLAWAMEHGDPGAAQVLHRCDTRLCCNPAHLFLGTHADNMADMVAKGRSASGDANAMRARPELRQVGDANPARRFPERLRRGVDQAGAVLDDAAVRDIRARYRRRETPLRMFAEQYGVGISTIFRVVQGTHWKHVS